MPAVRNERKKRLGAFLRGLRGRARTHRDVAAALSSSESKVSRIENGWVVPDEDDMDVMLRLYEATEQQQAEAWDLWRLAQQSTARTDLTGMPTKLHPLIRTEARANRSRVISPVIPALLQTTAYARALTVAGEEIGSVADVDEFVAARMRRQQRLAGEAPIRLDALIDEAAVRRRVGGKSAMRDQVRHLLAQGARPNVSIRIIPFVVGAYLTIAGPVNLFSYPNVHDQTQVYLEYPGGGAWVEEVTEVARFEDAFEATARMALTTGETAEFLTALMRELE